MEQREINVGLAIIKKWEGCHLQAYTCPAGVATTGWGSTRYLDGTKVKLGETITQKQADELLLVEVLKCRKQIRASVKVNLCWHEEAALISFVYNLGIGNLRASTLLRLLNSGDKAGAALQFQKWVYARRGNKKVKLQGLVNRRKDEEELFTASKLTA